MDAQLHLDRCGRRLIVLLPASQIYNTELAYKIHWLAYRENRDVLYLIVGGGNGASLEISRAMTTMKAVTAGNWLVANWRQTGTDDWLEILRAVIRSEDKIVCLARHTIKTDLFRKIRVQDFLEGTFQTHPVSVVDLPPNSSGNRSLREFLFWIGCFLILGIFAWLEFQISGTTHGAAEKITMIFALCIELGAVWTWNALMHS